MSAKSDLQLENGEVSSESALKWFKEVGLASVPPYFLTHWKTQKHFFHFENSLMAFEKTNGQLIISGEPALAHKGDDKKVYTAFVDFAHHQNKKVCGFYVGNSWNHEGFKKRPLGTSFRINLEKYDISSSKAKEVRRSLRKGATSDYTIVEPGKINQQKLQNLLKKWKRNKIPLKLKFFLSAPDSNSPTASFENWYAVEKNNRYYAFCSTLPYRNSAQEGLYIDHLIYDPQNEKSALSYLISSVIQKSKEDGISEVNLGLNPFANINSSGWTNRLFRTLYKIPFLYRPKGLHYFKRKFAGQEEPEFFFYEKKSNSLISLVGIVQTTFKR